MNVMISLNHVLRRKRFMFCLELLRCIIELRPQKSLSLCLEQCGSFVGTLSGHCRSTNWVLLLCYLDLYRSLDSTFSRLCPILQDVNMALQFVIRAHLHFLECRVPGWYLEWTLPDPPGCAHDHCVVMPLCVNHESISAN